MIKDNIVEHDGELTLCPFRIDGADFAFCYKDNRCPCYSKIEQGKIFAEFCCRDNIIYKYIGVKKGEKGQ